MLWSLNSNSNHNQFPPTAYNDQSMMVMRGELLGDEKRVNDHSLRYFYNFHPV